MKSDFKILICYNAPVSVFSNYSGKPDFSSAAQKDLSEHSFSDQIDYVKSAISEYYNNVSTLAIDRNVHRTIEELNNYSPDVIFNFVESVEGISNYEYCIAGLYELLGYHYTGNIPSTLGNCLNKERTKQILRSWGIKTAESLVLYKNQKLDENKIHLKYPVILKLVDEDASIGISELSVVKNFKELKKHFNFLSKNYNKNVIAEEYIVGRELNVAVLGNRTLPISEIDFTGLPQNFPKIVTYDGKWIEGSTYYNHTKPVCPAQLDGKIKIKVEETALLAFAAMNCRDYARVDIRLTSYGVPYVIEVNPNPDISSDSGFARAAAASGISHPELLNTITSFALVRKENDKKTKAV